VSVAILVLSVDEADRLEASLPVAVAMILWFWPSRSENRVALEREQSP